MSKIIKKRKKTEGYSVSLKEYIDSKFSELMRYIDMRFTGVEKATAIALQSVDQAATIALQNAENAADEAKKSMDIRLNGMNEFRESLKDQTANFITKSEHENLIKQLDEVRLFQATQKGMATQKSVYAAYVIAAVGIIIGLLK